MTAVALDAGGVTALLRQPARLRELRDRGLWPAQVCAAVLVETLTGDHRRDQAVNRLLRTCQIRDVDEQQSRSAGLLRARTGRPGSISAVDALVAALALSSRDALVLTSHSGDLSALLADAPSVVIAS